MNTGKLIWASIRHQKFQSILTLVLFTISVAISVAVISFTGQLGDRISKATKGIDLVVGAKGSPLQLILCNVFHVDYPTGNIKLIEAERISKHRLVKDALPLALGDAYEGFRIVGSAEKYKDWFECKISEGLWWSQNLEVVIGSEVAEKTGLTIGSKFASDHGLSESNGDHTEMLYRVVGILEATGGVSDRLILTSVPSLWAVHHLTVKPILNPSRLISSADISDSIAEITSLLLRYRNPLAALQLPRIINQGTTMQAASPAFESSRLQNLIGAGVEVLSAFAWLILFLSGFSIFISLLSGMKERQFDIAVMRVMGAGRLRIFSMIILEGLAISVTGTLLGFFLGHLALSGLFFGEAISRNGISPFYFNPDEIIIGGYAVVIGLIACLAPAVKAAYSDVHTILSR